MVSERIVGSDCMLFLGAGASAPLGLRPTVQFLELLQEQLPDLTNQRSGNSPDALGFAALFRQAGEHYETDPPDVELVLDYIDTLSSACDRLHSLPDEFQQLAATAGVPNVHEQWASMLRAIRDDVRLVIVEHYSRVNGSEALVLYEPLLTALSRTTNVIPVFTTNYDWTFEHLIDEANGGFELVDGFRRDSFGEAWTRSAFDQLESIEEKVRLAVFKLHGSTLWHRDTDNTIRKIPMTAPQLRESEAVLVFPTQSKTDAILQEPFKTAYEYFEESLRHCRLCIVIGFSFRDLAINEVVKRALINNSELKLAIVEPAMNQKPGVSFAELLNKLGLDDARWHDRLRVVVDRFGGDDVNQTLSETIDNLDNWGNLEHWIS